MFMMNAIDTCFNVEMSNNNVIFTGILFYFFFNYHKAVKGYFIPVLFFFPVLHIKYL